MQQAGNRPEAGLNPELERIRRLEYELSSMKKAFDAYKLERQQEESKRLRTALVAAGGIILALGSFVWMEIVWPVIQMGRNQ